MAVSLSQFVRIDENIVKMPKVALVNSTDTMPPKTRTLDTSPLFPPPTNIGEIGNYPFVASDPTPIGDEKFDEDNPPNFAIEYMVFVTDEGSGVNVSSEETFEIIDGWSAHATATNVGLTGRDPTQGSKSIKFSKSIGTTRAGVEKSVTRNYSEFIGTNYFFDIYFPSLAGIEAAEFVTEDGSGNQHAWEDTSLSVGWNLITLPVDTPNLIADVGFDITNIKKLIFRVRTIAPAVTFTGVEVDDFKGTEILTGKVEQGDVKVAFARNSAWQTRFEFNQSLNRWALLNGDLGVVTNTAPRLQIPTKFTNDFSNRAVDFEIELAGTPLTVATVADESGFGTPAAGTVEFALAETTFNFSTADLATFEGKSVTYKEVQDDEVTVSSSGVAPLERNIDMTFGINPEQAKKDLTLNLSLEDEILSNELTATKEIPISFVPISTSLRYDPLPEGAPNPLVEGTDFVIDEDKPSILFTRSVAAEYILSDFNSNPQNPGDPDSGQAKFFQLPLNNQDCVETSVGVTQTNPAVGALTEDEGFLVDLAAGVIFLTHGLTEELLMSNIFIPDTAFVEINFSFYINGDELMEYTLVPDVGWVNLDDPLFPGDVVTVDYISEDDTLGETVDGVPPSTPFTGQFVRTPGVELQNGTLITNDAPAVGGEFSFTVQNPPVQVTKFTVEDQEHTLALEGDRTGDYLADGLIQMDVDVYQITGVSYNASTDVTTITLAVPARSQYTNPATYYTKKVVSDWTTEATSHGPIPEGVSKFVLTGGGDLQSRFFEGVLLRFPTLNNDVYAVKGSTKVNDDADLQVQLTTKLTAAVQASDTFERTITPIPKVGGTEFHTFYTPILDLPDRFDSNGDLLGLDDRFPGLGNDSIRVIRNSVDLVRDFDYEITFDGTIKLLRDPLVSADDEIALRYVPLRDSEMEDELTADYVYFAESESGVGLRGTIDYVLPDTFYFRVVNNNTQAGIYSGILKAFVKQKTGQVSSGSSPAIPGASGNHESGVDTPITGVGKAYDNDLIVQRIYDFYNERIGFLEAEKMELCGEIAGGWTGPLTQDDVESNALGSGRTFPIDADITFAVEDKDTEELIIPARPYRVPAIFGMAVEDDISRVVRDKDYPRIPIVTFPPFPPQGQRFKGANNEPTAFGILGAFGAGSAASASTTFIENWYPGNLDRDYTNPLTSATYITYGPTVYDSDNLEVNQDTGDPSDATPIFPPASNDLDPGDYEGFDVSVFPMPAFESAAPRDKSEVPPNYEAAAIGALQSIDTAIETFTLAGIPHRQLFGIDTSYNDSLGWVYRDMNEYDLLTNGTSGKTEEDLIQAQWATDFGSRTTPSDYEDNIKQQILVLSIQVESLQRQMDTLDLLIAQITPAPTGDPEQTTYDQAVLARTAAGDAQTLAQFALDDAEAFYTDTIIGSDWSDTELIDRWLHLQGVDATGTPSGSTGDPLPYTPVTGPARFIQVPARIVAIVDRLAEINQTLGFDNTQEPVGFDTIDESENLYTQRYNFLDQRLNRESGTLFKALQAHYQYVKDIQESANLLSLIGILGG